VRISEHAQRRAFLDSHVLSACSLILSTAMLVFTVRTLQYARELPLDVLVYLLPQKALSVAIFAALKWLISSGRVGAKHANLVALLILLNANLSVMFTAYLAPQQDPGTFLQLMVVGTGLIMLSRRQAVHHLVLTWLTWFAVHSLAPQPADTKHALTLAIFSAVSWISMEMRLRIISQLYTLRVQDEERNRMLCEALQEAETSRQLLDQRVEERTAELYCALREREQISQEKHALQEELFHTRKVESLGRLAGGIAHDFNNLLTIIMAHLELAALHTEDEELRENLTCAREAAEGGARLTSRLLAFSRKQVMRPERVDLVAVVEDLRKLVLPLLGEDIQVRIDSQVSAAPVLADAGQLQQVLLNLCVNARDAMPDGGCLTVSLTSSEEGWVSISVGDTGCGIPPELQSLVFEPFFTTKTAGRGTGLGLSTVEGIVSQLGGRVDLWSQSGLGTTVTVSLPEVCQATTKARDTAAEPAPEQPAGAQRVLLVEDEEGLRTLTAGALRRFGHTVSCAANALAALDVVTQAALPPEVLVTDVVMPGMDGGELARQLKARLPHLRVLFVSGYTDDRLEGLPLNQPDYGFLAKPYSMDQLRQNIDKLARRHPADAGAPERHVQLVRRGADTTRAST
jgi:two-component system, cell cycle sensor histidine kinase and response regulator CckA